MEGGHSGRKSFWTTAPGVASALATVVAAITGILVWLDQRQAPSDGAQSPPPSASYEAQPSQSASAGGPPRPVRTTTGAPGAAGAADAASPPAVTSKPVSLFDGVRPRPTDTTEQEPVEVGMKFSPSVDGTVTHLQFYKAATDNSTMHTGTLWSDDGKKQFAQVTFNFEPHNVGWQTKALPAPIAIQAGRTYVVSYHAQNKTYARTSHYFVQPRTAGPLTARAGQNGVYSFGATPTFPRESSESSNYWVDITFVPKAG